MQVQKKVITRLSQLAILASLCVVGASCSSTKRYEPVTFPKWRAWSEPITTPEDMRAALETRFTPEMIRAYCRANPPTPASVQRLVPIGQVWRGVLYPGQEAALGKVCWYADVEKGRLRRYEVDVNKGRDYWLLTIGDEPGFGKPPYLRWLPKEAYETENLR